MLLIFAFSLLIVDDLLRPCLRLRRAHVHVELRRACARVGLDLSNGVVKRRHMRAKREGADSTRRAGPLYRNARAAAGVRHQPPVRHVCAPSLRPGLRASVDSQRAHHKYARGSCRPLRPCDQNAACRLACSISCLATWTSSATANRGRGGQRCGRRRDQRSSAATTLVF